ncbi:hypothetical protein F5Y02DRAFT_400657 [Annulohypoxylon stygium]|nr:hypothetical protein F5Y02DRAFT_400657 [Annulohypoxylon stygium]
MLLWLKIIVLAYIMTTSVLTSADDPYGASVPVYFQSTLFCAFPTFVIPTLKRGRIEEAKNICQPTVLR